MGRYTELITFLVTKEQREYLDELSKETGKSIGSLLRELIDEQIRAEREEHVAVILDKNDLKLLQEIYRETAVHDVSEMVSRIITVFHALTVSGFWRFLKPAEEIYKMILAERGEVEE
jgi:predicted DNA-binding protein